MNKKSVLIFGIIAIIIIVAIVIVISLSSGNKVPTIEEFEQKAIQQEFTISSIDNIVTQSKPVTVAKMAVSSDSKYTIEMYVLENEEATKELYNEKKQNYEERKQEGDNSKETNKSNTNIYTLKANGNCMYIKRVNNTIISYNVKEADEKKVIKFIKSL